jgi:hypothetical protein
MRLPAAEMPRGAACCVWRVVKKSLLERPERRIEASAATFKKEKTP